MTGYFELDGPGVPPPEGGPPRELVILLHGYGADGNDLINLAPHWTPLLPHAYFVAPHAPYPCELGPWGRQWFGLGDHSELAMLAGTRAAAPVLDAFIDARLAEHGLSEDRLALVGFSQGTMMALHVAPRRARVCAAVVGYSGRLVGADDLAAEARSRPPVLLFHGDADALIPAQAMPQALEGLRAADIPAEGHIRPGLGHGIDAEGLARAGQFLKQNFAR